MTNTVPESPSRVRIGISSCLLGEAVRFDGGHKRDPFLADDLSRYVEWVPVCPEVEMGLGVPRETLRLVDEGSGPQLLSRSSKKNHTGTMRDWSAARLERLRDLELCGFVFKRGSPSCGMERVKVYRHTGLLHTRGVGIFAGIVTENFPNLPVEEEGRLTDPRLRENFFSAVLSYRRWMDLMRCGSTTHGLMQFHARHKYLLMAHSQAQTRALGRLTTSAPAYFNLFSAVMRVLPTRRNHTNVLQHLAGYVSRKLNTPDRTELTDVITSYRMGILPLIVPITLIRHYVRHQALTYLDSQVYLQPHPSELKLLNTL